MYKIPFFIGTFISYFVPGRENRRRVRGHINKFFFYIPIALFIKRVYGEKTKTIRFIRQISMKRVTCVVNDKYYVKVFRFVSVKRLNEYKFLLDFIRPYLSVKIPDVYVAKHIPMYVAERLPGRDMCDFDKELILKNEKKIKKQVFDIIAQLQSVPVDEIPDNIRFAVKLQAKKPATKPVAVGSVLAHCDLNAGNLLLDEKLNILSIIDWDSTLIVPNPDTDKEMFEKLWSVYKNGK